MAKSFKQLAAAKEEQPKRTSEKDIFDFLEEDRTPVPAGKATRNNTSNTAEASESKAALAAGPDQAEVLDDEERDLRQTFIIGQSYLERLKDYVHTKRVQGQYEYTQKQALHDALDMLFQGVDIKPRPEHIRKQEDARKQKIRRGIPK